MSNFFPILPVSVHFLHYFAKIIISPTFRNVPPVFVKCTCFFYILYVYFVPSYFCHDAFMHHTKHVLDTPAVTTVVRVLCLYVLKASLLIQMLNFSLF